MSIVSKFFFLVSYAFPMIGLGVLYICFLIIDFLSSTSNNPPFHWKLLQTKLDPILFIFSTQLKIKLYNFTASKYEILWIMLFMNHKLPSICLLWYPRSSTNNKAQMILYRVCPPILIKLLICTLHKQISRVLLS